MQVHTSRQIPLASLALLLFLLPAGCTRQQSHTTGVPSQVLLVATSSPVIHAFSAQILATDNGVRLVVPNGRHSRDWRPTRTAAAEIRDAKLVILTGAGWEPWSERISLAPSRTLDLSAPIIQSLIEIPDAITHQHGPDGAHSHKGFVWTTWLSPQLLLRQLPELQSALIKVAPDRTDQIQRESGRLRTALQPLADLCTQLKTIVPQKQLSIVTDGPEFLYLLQDLGIDPVRIRWPLSSPADSAVLQQIQTNAQRFSGQSPLMILNDRRSKDHEKPVLESGFQILRLDDLEQAAPPRSVIERLTENVKALQAWIESAPAATQP